MTDTKRHRNIIRAVRYVCLAVWLAAIVAGVGSFLLDPGSFTAEHIAAFLSQFHDEIWIVYLIMSALRGFSLLPSTPLVIAGTLLFPSQPFTVLAVCLTGIAISSSMIYFFSEFLGFHDYFESHKPELTHKICSQLDRPAGFVFVGLWSFLPLVPTDLVCYLAGTTRMNFWKFISAVILGETILCAFYVYLGGTVVNRWL